VVEKPLAMMTTPLLAPLWRSFFSKFPTQKDAFDIGFHQ